MHPYFNPRVCPECETENDQSAWKCQECGLDFEDHDEMEALAAGDRKHDQMKDEGER